MNPLHARRNALIEIILVLVISVTITVVFFKVMDAKNKANTEIARDK